MSQAEAPSPAPSSAPTPPSLGERLSAKLPTRRRVLGTLVLLVLFVVGTAGLYTFASLNWSYSEGDRAGTLLKVSKKGWLCKTYEGELLMALVADQQVPGDSAGISSNTWHFTVRDENVVTAMNAAVGKRVVLHYTEHKGVPSSCFGDTPYYVDSVREEGAR